MTKFKVGDEITYDGAIKGKTGIITRIDSKYGKDKKCLWCNWSDDSPTESETYVYEDIAILVKKGKGSKKGKVVKRKEHNWAIIKASCNNYELHLTGKTVEEATTKLESLGCGYELYKLSTWFARTTAKLETRQKKKVKRKPGRPKKVKK